MPQADPYAIVWIRNLHIGEPLTEVIREAIARARASLDR